MLRKACGFLALSSLFLAPRVEASLTFRQVVRNEGGEGASAADMTSKVWIGDEAARIDIERMAANPMMSAGGYLLLRDDAMFFVDPAKKSYFRMDPEMLGSMVGALEQTMQGMEQAGVSMRFEPGAVEKQLEEDGGVVAGYPTRHYRYRSTFSSTMETPMGSVISETDALEDVWTTTAIELPTGFNPEMMESFSGSALGGKMKEIAEVERSKMTGFPLRRVVVSRAETRATGMMKMGGFGRASDAGPTTITMEVSDIATEDIPASTFEIPADYAEVEMMAPSGPAMPDLNEMEN